MFTVETERAAELVTLRDNKLDAVLSSDALTVVVVTADRVDDGDTRADGVDRR